VNSNHGLRRGEAQPQLAVTVQLDEGPRILAVIEDAPSTSVNVGAKVCFHGTHTMSDQLPVFRLNPDLDSAA
jgi:hypothetical protein